MEDLDYGEMIGGSIALEVFYLSGCGAGLLDPFLGGVPELDRDGDGGLDSLPFPLVVDG